MSKRSLPPKRGDGNTQGLIQEVVRPDMNAALRATIGFKLRFQEGKTWEEVAQGAGYASRGAARNGVLREAQRHITRDIDETRDMERYRIEQLQQRCYDAGIDKAEAYWTFAIDRYVALSKRKSELLNLDKHPDEELTNANYIKKVILIDDDVAAGGEHVSSTS